MLSKSLSTKGEGSCTSKYSVCRELSNYYWSVSRLVEEANFRRIVHTILLPFWGTFFSQKVEINFSIVE